VINTVATYDNLSKRRVDVTYHACVMCSGGEESILYLFFDCTIAGNLWKLCDKWIGIVTAHQNI